ncbi:hypothetical protein FLA_1720 [Filimonas lacunae]|nr:hypothetical protein FLA_1720 [Filimonas lacunae]
MIFLMGSVFMLFAGYMMIFGSLLSYNNYQAHKGHFTNKPTNLQIIYR